MAKAAQLYGQAAEQGYAPPQFHLGTCYASGEGVELDEANAVRLCGQAAEQDDAYVQYLLGTCYLRGEGVREGRGERGAVVQAVG
jgi:TPR repeat protein